MHNRQPNEVDNADCLPDEDGYCDLPELDDTASDIDWIKRSIVEDVCEPEYAYADWSGIARLYPDLELVP